MAYESLMVFTGNANPLLAHGVVRRLNIPSTNVPNRMPKNAPSNLLATV